MRLKFCDEKVMRQTVKSHMLWINPLKLLLLYPIHPDISFISLDASGIVEGILIDLSCLSLLLVKKTILIYFHLTSLLFNAQFSVQH